MHEPNPAVLEAIEIAGSQKALAEMTGVPPSFVSQWATGKRPVPSTKCLAIEKGTGVGCHRLRPDVFPPKTEAPKPKTEAA